MCKETAENGTLLKEYCYMHDYGKPSDCNNYKMQIQWIFHFLSYLNKNSTASSFISYQTRQNLDANLRLLSFF